MTNPSSPVPAAQIKTLLRNLPHEIRDAGELAMWQDVPDDELVTLYDGGVSAEELHCWGPTVVQGDVNVTWEFSTRDGAVLVLGSIICGNAVIRSELNVLGSLVAETYVYANTSNDYSLGVWETLRAKLFVEEGMWTSAKVIEAVVWSSVNEVYNGDHKVAHVPPTFRTRAAAGACGLDEDDLDDLAVHCSFVV